VCYKGFFHSIASLLDTAVMVRAHADGGDGKLWVNKYPNSAGHFKPAMSAKDVRNKFHCFTVHFNSLNFIYQLMHLLYTTNY